MLYIWYFKITIRSRFRIISRCVELARKHSLVILKMD